MARRDAGRSRATAPAADATRSAAARRALRAGIGLAVGATALAISSSPAAAVEVSATRECDGSVTLVLTDIPSNLTVQAVNVRIVGDTVFYDLEYEWDGDPEPEQVETDLSLALPPLPEDCEPETTPPTVPTTPPTTSPTLPPPDPGFAFSIRSLCRNDTPYVAYEASVDGIAPGTPMVLHWVDANGVERATQNVTLGSGEVLWPGAEIDANGDPTDWPGWIQQSDGEWIEGPDGFEWARPQVRVFATVNPTSAALALSYPPSNPLCRAQPPDTGITTLPATGDDSQQPLVAAGVALLATGAALTVLAKARAERLAHAGRRATNR